MGPGYNLLGFVLVAAFAIFMVMVLLFGPSSQESQPTPAPPFTRDGAEDGIKPL
jgi:hypothetical protein